MNNSLVKLLGWKATVLHGDPCVYDRWKWLQSQLLPGKMHTLDAGCGSGPFTMYAAKIGNRSLGISFDERNNQVAQERAKTLKLTNIKFMEGDLRELDEYGDQLGKFDQVICMETIEHILHDDKLIADLSARLAPGGRLLITTPYKHYRHMVDDHLSEYEDGGHVRWGYTHEEMRALFNKHGLEVVAEDYISGVVSQQITNLMRLLGKKVPQLAWPATFPLRVLQPLDRTLTRLTGYPYLSIAVVGIKRNGQNRTERA